MINLKQKKITNNHKVCFLIHLKKDIFISDKQDVILNFHIKRLKFFFKCQIWFLDFENLYPNNSKFSNIIIKDVDKIKSIIKNYPETTNFFIFDATTPIIDNDLINRMNKFLETTSEKIISSGAIPGTFPDVGVKQKNVILYLQKKYIKSTVIYHDSQKQFNNQFNLKRPLRIKLFLGLIKKFPNVYRFSIPKIIKILESKKCFNFLLDYCETINTKELKKCPNCNSDNKKPLYFSSSQPATGFLPSSIPLYFECMDCNLIFLRKQCVINDLKYFYDVYERPQINHNKIISDFFKKKTGTHYNEKIIVTKILYKYLTKHSEIVDIGCGFGELVCSLKSINPKWKITGIDFDLEKIDHIFKKNNIISFNMNFLNFFNLTSDAITLLHVIEHVPFYQLEFFISNIFNSLKKDGLFIISTPNFNSPLAKLFDYTLMFPPVHQTIFSDTWLIDYLEKNWKFKLIEKKSSSAILENFDNWFGYFVDNAPTDEYKTLAKSFFTLKKNKQKFTNFHSYINDNNFGSEVILVFKKL